MYGKNYQKTYIDSNYDNLCDLLFLFYKIFMRSAEFVANKSIFHFPKEKGVKVLALLKQVNKLPADAKIIYLNVEIYWYT